MIRKPFLSPRPGTNNLLIGLGRPAVFTLKGFSGTCGFSRRLFLPPAGFPAGATRVRQPRLNCDWRLFALAIPLRQIPSYKRCQIWVGSDGPPAHTQRAPRSLIFRQIGPSACSIPHNLPENPQAPNNSQLSAWPVSALPYCRASSLGPPSYLSVLQAARPGH